MDDLIDLAAAVVEDHGADKRIIDGLGKAIHALHEAKIKRGQSGAKSAFLYFPKRAEPDLVLRYYRNVK